MSERIKFIDMSLGLRNYSTNILSEAYRKIIADKEAHSHDKGIAIPEHEAKAFERQIMSRLQAKMYIVNRVLFEVPDSELNKRDAPFMYYVADIFFPILRGQQPEMIVPLLKDDANGHLVLRNHFNGFISLDQRLYDPAKELEEFSRVYERRTGSGVKRTDG